jgi:hypothetical protein
MFGRRRRERAKRQREAERTIHLDLQRNLAAYSMTRQVTDDFISPKPNAVRVRARPEFVPDAPASGRLPLARSRAASSSGSSS